MPDKPEGKNSCSVLLSRVFMSPFLTDTEVQQIIAEEALSNISGTEDQRVEDPELASNGLENFGMEEEEGIDLFSSENDNKETQDLLSTENSEESSEEDDLEIPAFLRRQKN